MNVEGTEEMQPNVPSPCKLEKRAAEEMNVEGTEEMQPNVPSPCSELVSCGVEIILDKDREDK